MMLDQREGGLGVKVKYGKSSNKIKESESEIKKVLKLFSKEVKVKYRKSSDCFQRK